MTASNTCACTRPVDGAYACTTCVDTASDNLNHIAELCEHLDEKRAGIRSNWTEPTISEVRHTRWRTDDAQRATMPTATNTPRGTSTGVSLDPRVSETEHYVRNALVGNIRVIWDQINDDPRGLTGESSTSDYARYVARHVYQMRLLPEASDEFSWIARAAAKVSRLFDKPPAQLYLGYCRIEGCEQPLYVDRPAPDASMRSQVTCRRCKHVHDTEDRRTELMAGVDDYHGTAKEISHLLRTMAGSDVSVRMIYSYADHGLIHAAGTRTEYDKNGRPREASVYSIGAVREAAKTMRSKREERRGKRDEKRARVAC